VMAEADGQAVMLDNNTIQKIAEIDASAVK
jgi:hypothetical protein